MGASHRLRAGVGAPRILCAETPSVGRAAPACAEDGATRPTQHRYSRKEPRAQGLGLTVTLVACFLWGSWQWRAGAALQVRGAGTSQPQVGGGLCPLAPSAAA